MDFEQINNNNYDYNRAQTLVFLDIMNKFMHAVDYEDKLKIANEIWGELKDLPKIYYYGDYCSVKIHQKDKEIKFDFDCSHINLELLQQGSPDFADKLKDEVARQSKEQVISEDRELSTETENNDKTSTKEALEKISDINYINLYNNIKFKK